MGLFGIGEEKEEPKDGVFDEVVYKQKLLVTIADELNTKTPITWIKVAEGIFARKPNLDSPEIINIKDIENRINWLNEQIKTPKDLEQLQAFWDAYYGNSPYKQELEKLQELLNILGDK